MTKGVSVLTIT